MTFNPTEYQIWCKEYPMFNLWAVRRGILFVPKEVAEDENVKKYDLTSKIYIFMKRLGQDYNTVMTMDADERDTLFEMEMKLIEEEKKKQDELNRN